MDLVTFILGTRPEAIKLAPVILKFKNSEIFNIRVVLTGQHQEMIYQVLDLFNIDADKDLKLMETKQTLTHITCNTLYGLEEDFKKNRPNLAIVQGDTTTALSSALSAFYLKIPVAHIEAGLRTKDKFIPYPEELNRRLISQIASLHFSPTKLAKSNLDQSGIFENVYITGNTVVDAVLKISSKAKAPKIKSLNWDKQKIILLTVHRRENWGENIKNIAFAIQKLTTERNDIAFVIPMHKNQIVRDTLIENLSGKKNIFLTEPLNYDKLIGAIKKSYIVMTDSGGLQEEVPSFGKPVLVLRNNTEREEAIKAGTAKLIGSETDNIINEVLKLLNNKSKYKEMSEPLNPFGDGKSSERILNHCINFLKSKEIK